MVYADPFYSYCVALVVACNHSLEKWAQQAGVEYKDFPDMCNKHETVTEVLQSISKVSQSVHNQDITDRLSITRIENGDIIIIYISTGCSFKIANHSLAST